MITAGRRGSILPNQPAQAVRDLIDFCRADRQPTAELASNPIYSPHAAPALYNSYASRSGGGFWRNIWTLGEIFSTALMKRSR
jgi:hypothetical protein